MLPNQEILKKVSEKIKNIPNRQGEYKRKIHYGCYLLCSQSGLRISEAINFDLANKTKRGLYRINKPKGKKERYVYVSSSVINELKKHNWQPNQTNRWNFYHFLRKIKRELNISKSTELTPHTLRRTFTTHHANSGMPLPLLQKLLGHSSIRTTALYWHNTHGDGDINDILVSKKWLENKEPTEPLIAENLPEQLPVNSEPAIMPAIQSITTRQKPVISNKKPIQQDNYLSTKKNQQLINGILPRKSEKFFLDNIGEKNDQLEISQSLALTANQETKPNKKEAILLTKIKHLEEHLTQIQTENINLRVENKHLKSLIQQDVRGQKTEIQAQIIQPLPLKFK